MDWPRVRVRFSSSSVGEPGCKHRLEPVPIMPAMLMIRKGCGFLIPPSGLRSYRQGTGRELKISRS
jgi:hypothetical protein